MKEQCRVRRERIAEQVCHERAKGQDGTARQAAAPTAVSPLDRAASALLAPAAAGSFRLAGALALIAFPSVPLMLSAVLPYRWLCRSAPAWLACWPCGGLLALNSSERQPVAPMIPLVDLKSDAPDYDCFAGLVTLHDPRGLVTGVYGRDAASLRAMMRDPMGRGSWTRSMCSIALPSCVRSTRFARATARQRWICASSAARSRPNRNSSSICAANLPAAGTGTISSVCSCSRAIFPRKWRYGPKPRARRARPSAPTRQRRASSLPSAMNSARRSTPFWAFPTSSPANISASWRTTGSANMWR